MKKRIKATILAAILFAASSTAGAEVAFNVIPLASSSSSSSASETIWDVLADIFSLVWIINNLTVNFDSYPYANGKYLNFSGFSMYGSDRSTDSAMQDWRFEVETNAFVFPKKIWGNESRLEGIFWKFLGPVFENTIYYPSDDWEDNDDFKNHTSELPPAKVASQYIDTDRKYAGNVKLGGQLTLWYSNPLSVSVFLQWSKWYGAVDASGIGMGIIAKSYPFDPILIEWRGSVNSLKDRYEVGDIYESHLEVGAMVAPRIEAYAAWKYTHNPLLNVKGHGAALGAKVHF